MGAIPVVGADDLGQDGVEVVVVQRDDVVEALATEPTVGRYVPPWATAEGRKV